MKRFGLLMIITLLVIGTVSAQGWGRDRDNRRGPSRPNTAITVEGTLQLQNGMIALASGDTVYYVPVLQRYIGFIEGLKEGNSVSVEGYVFRNVLQPAKVTINGKAYDFPVKSRGPEPCGFGPGNRLGPGRNDIRPGDRRGPGRSGYDSGPGRQGPRWGRRN